MGEIVPEVLMASGGTQTEGTVSPNMDCDLKVSGNFYFSLQPMCVEEGRVRVDVVQSARSIANQNKTLQDDF